MTKIIHLSDLHCGDDDCLDKFEYLTNKIISNFTPDQCVIVITGDLVDDSYKEPDYLPPRKLIEKLEYANFQVLVVPGNHDYGPGSGFYKDVKNKAHNFKRIFFSNPKNNHPEWANDDFYPKVDFVGNGDDKIAFIGLDSNEGEIENCDESWPSYGEEIITDDGSGEGRDGQITGFDKNNFNPGADGKIGTNQLNRLKERLNKENVKQCKYRVIYFHHHAYQCVIPPPFSLLHGLKDRSKLKKLIKKYQKENPDHQINALLYGHEHWFKVEEEGLWDVPLCIDAGSSTGKRKIIFPKNKIRVIDLSKEDSKKYDTFDWLDGYHTNNL